VGSLDGQVIVITGGGRSLGGVFANVLLPYAPTQMTGNSMVAERRRPRRGTSGG
jgi:hypothetical protein